MDLGLTGRRALVAGGSAGLGAAVAGALRDEGTSVVVVARDTPRLRETAERMGAAAVAADLSTPGGPAEAVAAATERLGGLDLLLVNSGGPPAGAFEALADADWQKALDGTFWSTLRLIREALPHLRQGDAPAILVILSSSVREPIPQLATSNTLRPGLAGLVKTLTAEIAPIRINAIAPGRIATERVAQLDAGWAARDGIDVAEIQRRAIARIPLGRYGEPAELGRVAAFLLSPAASYVNGVILSVDGGMYRSLP